MTRRRSRAGNPGAGLIGVAIILWCVSASAQQPAIGIGSHVGLEPSGYDDGGRRDPFVSLIVPKPEAPAPAAAAPVRRVGVGLAGLSITDAVVRGVIRNGDAVTGIIEAPDGKTYLVHPHDRLQDGVVLQIGADAIVFTEQVTDMAGAAHTKEVRKEVARAGGGGGQ